MSQSIAQGVLSKMKTGFGHPFYTVLSLVIGWIEVVEKGKKNAKFNFFWPSSNTACARAPSRAGKVYRRQVKYH